MSLGRALMVMCFCRKQLSDKLGSYPPLKSNLTLEHPPWMKMYLLLEMKICQCHVKSFPGCMCFFLWSMRWFFGQLHDLLYGNDLSTMIFFVLFETLILRASRCKRHSSWYKLLPSWELTYPWKVHFEDDFPFPQVGYVNFLKGIIYYNHYEIISWCDRFIVNPMADWWLVSWWFTWYFLVEPFGRHTVDGSKNPAITSWGW